MGILLCLAEVRWMPSTSFVEKGHVVLLLILLRVQPTNQIPILKSHFSITPISVPIIQLLKLPPLQKVLAEKLGVG